MLIVDNNTHHTHSGSAGSLSHPGIHFASVTSFFFELFFYHNTYYKTRYVLTDYIVPIYIPTAVYLHVYVLLIYLNNRLCGPILTPSLIYMYTLFLLTIKAALFGMMPSSSD